MGLQEYWWPVDLLCVWFRFTAALLSATVSSGGAQTVVADAYERTRSMMRTSIEKQHASVRAQGQHPVPVAAAGFFSSPWLTTSMLRVTPPADCDRLPPSELQPLINASASKYGVKIEIIRAVIDKESGGRPCAVSARGAQGLMQIMPDTGADLSVADPFDPKQNVDAGVRYLKTLLDRFKGDLTLALGAYNAGISAVEKGGGLPQNAETQDYVRQILNAIDDSKATSSLSPNTDGASTQAKPD
jgi:soluble lytic murein transglycosylase-like protein